jgi:hypothetical protein
MKVQPNERTNMTTYYFAADGSYGRAEDIIIIDTANWSDEEWEAIDMASDSARHSTAAQIIANASPEQLPLEFS